MAGLPPNLPCCFLDRPSPANLQEFTPGDTNLGNPGLRIVPQWEWLQHCDHIEEQGKRLFEFACQIDWKGLFQAEELTCQFTDSQNLLAQGEEPELPLKTRGDDLFAPEAKKSAQPDWTGCALVVAEAEM